ncbi:MAG TPA: MurR/RpiR family transcriptional regulator [Rectinemataceae bacterium]|nr:MurR/RpiR family transcriptional regulator [Rectinemataceae bacterium]
MDEQKPFESAIASIELKLDSLSESERKIAEYVLREPKKTLHYNVSELARQSGSSQAAVVRFCKRIALGSFGNFKLRLAHDVFRDADERFIPDLDLESKAAPAHIIRSVIDQAQRSLGLLASCLDPAAVEAAADAILGASMTALFGVGASGVVAYDFLQKLLRVGLPAAYTADTDLQVTTASTLRPTDLAIVFSYSGENASMLEVARQARERKVRVISLTMDSDNSVRRLADIALLVPASERIYRQGASTSRVNQLTVVDIIFSILVSRNLDGSIGAIERTMLATHRGGPTKIPHETN